MSSTTKAARAGTAQTTAVTPPDIKGIHSDAVTYSVMQSANDAAYPDRASVSLRSGEFVNASRSLALGHVRVFVGSNNTSLNVALELSPWEALELSTALRRQAETLQREMAARGGVV